MVDGKPFFPFGFYHVSWHSTAEERLNALRDIAAAGFNTIHASASNLSDYGGFLDEAERLGVSVLTEYGGDALDLVNTFKNSSAVLGWNIADDVDNGKMTPNDVMKAHQKVKASDPTHLTYVSGYSDQIGQFANRSDVVAMQSYPIEVGEKEEISAIYAAVSIARDAAAKSNQIVYANLQTFNWATVMPQEYQGTRQPTFDEVRNMTYQALLAGAKGIIYYTYHDQSWHLPNQADLWESMKSLPPEINAISPLLLNGTFQKVDADKSDLFAGIWTNQDQGLAIVVNSSYEPTPAVSIKLPTGMQGAQALFENRTSSLVVQGDQLVGSLNPLEVQVYKFNL